MPKFQTLKTALFTAANCRGPLNNFCDEQPEFSRASSRRKRFLEVPHNWNEPRAFTLIELLVVISIIALLVSILLPSLSKAKMLAKEVSCRASLKAIGTGWIMYRDDHPGVIPNAVYFPEPPPGVNEVSIMDILAPPYISPEIGRAHV